MQTLHYFAGGNTAGGFYSCFEDILPPAERKRMYFIKGGPGVGKSTLMKQVGHAAEAKGHEVAYYHCSSDPDSLDGVSLPQLGIGMMDGTAPHVYDPVIPGARDTLLSLGDFLDEKALAPHAGEIGRIQQEISARFARCYRYLAAAREVRAAAPCGVENAERAAQTAQAWVKSLPLRGGRGTVRRLFASAFTPKGLLDILPFDALERRVTLDCPFGADATGLMAQLSAGARERGLDVVELLDPLTPSRVAHVLIPAHGIAFCTGRRSGQSGEWLDAQSVFDLSQAREKESSFDRNAYELLLERATEQLSGAKTLHDELETHYVRHMDFAGWQTVLDAVVAALP